MTKPKRDTSQKAEKRKPGRPEKPVSLKPLEFEDALRDLIATGKPDGKKDGGVASAPGEATEQVSAQPHGPAADH